MAPRPRTTWVKNIRDDLSSLDLGIPVHHSRHRHHIRALQLIDTFKVGLKTLYLFDSS